MSPTIPRRPAGSPSREAFATSARLINAWTADAASEPLNVGGLMFRLPHADPWPSYTIPFLFSPETSGYRVVSIPGPTLSERQNVARDFAERARQEGVGEVWVRGVAPELCLAVVIPDPDLDFELRLHALFVEVVRTFGDPSLGDLEVHVESDGVPDDARMGERLV